MPTEITAENKHCVIRVNANSELGNGHLMRCLTLARLAKSHNIKPLLVLTDVPDAPITFINAAQCDYVLLPEADEFLDAQLLCKILANLNAPCWVVVDVYAFSARWHEVVYPNCQQLLVIDDLANRSYFCDFLLDHTPGRSPEDYMPRLNATAQIHVGAACALLAPEFFAALEDARPIRAGYFAKKTKPKLLISLGGTDPKQLSLVWFDLLAGFAGEFGGITFLLASNAQVIAPLAAKINHHNQSTGAIKLVINAANMPQLLLEHDLAIGGAGVSALERAVLGLPSIMLTLADNQIKQAQALHELGCAINLGDWQQVPDEAIQHAAREQLMQLKNNYAKCQAISERAFSLISGHAYQVVWQFFNGSREE